MGNITTVAKFREKLSSWLDSAEQAPVFINRGGQRFALMNEDIYRDLEQKIGDLQSSLIGILENKEDSTSSNLDDILPRLKKFKREKA